MWENSPFTYPIAYLDKEVKYGKPYNCHYPRNQIDEIVYNEETNKLSSELNGLRQQMVILEEEENQEEKIKERVDEVIQILRLREDILEQFDNNLFNALVEKITVLSSAHFDFTLKSGMTIDEIIEY